MQRFFIKIAVFLPLIVVLTFNLPARATTFTVSNLNDSGPGSLRQALIDANNATVTADTIVFQPGLSGVLLLTSGGFGPITGQLTINGLGPSLTINGNNASRLFTINSGVTAVFSNLKLKNGGISNYGTLTLNQSTIQDTIWQSYFGGAAIYNQGTLTLNSCVLSANSSINESGGAIYNSGTLTINKSTLVNNSSPNWSAGAIYNGGTLSLNDTTLSGNSAARGGGAIYQDGGTSLSLKNSTLTNNSAQGSGGGLYSTVSTTTVNNSTFSGNSANGSFSEGGGGIYYFNGTLTILNSTFTGNSAVSGWAGGLYVDGSAALSIGNTILSGNNSPTGKEAYNEGTFNSLGNNLFGENGSSGLVGVSAIASDIILPGALSTAIGPLANNGGPTQTHLPVAGGPAINGGNNQYIPLGVIIDQRGYGPRIVGAAVDIGSVEVGAVAGYSLTVNKTGGNGIVRSIPAGVNCGSVCVAAFPYGQPLTLSAIPDPGYSFTGWLGSCSGATCQLTMTAPKSVTALFANIPSYVLTVTKAGTGAGTVASNPAGISCGADCNQSYPTNTVVTLTATPGAGSAFVGWSGVCAGTTPSCVVTVNAAKTATATFKAVATLTVSKTGTGAGLILGSGVNCGTDCSEAYALNTVVTLAASAYAGSAFAGWIGCASNPTPQQCTVTLSAARSVVARFNNTAAGKTAITLYKSGVGLGTVLSNPIGINCGATCNSAVGSFISNAAVTLTATPAVGSTFSGWSGCTPNPVNPRQCTVVLNAGKVVVATFIRPVLTVSKIGSGLIATAANSTGIFCGADCTEPYNLNTVVRLVAIPGVGRSFGSWTGCAPDPSFPQMCTVTMSQARAVSATFH